MAIAGVYRGAILEFAGPRILAQQGVPGVSFTVARFGADNLRLENLVLGPDVKANSISVTYSAEGLFSGRFKEFLVDGLRVETRSLDQGFIGIVRSKVAPEQSGGETSAPLPPLPRMKLVDGRVRLFLAGIEADVAMSADLAPDLSGNAAATISVAAKSIVGRDLRLRDVDTIVQSAPEAETVTAAFSGGVLEDLGTQSKLGAVNIEGNVEYSDGWVEADIEASTAAGLLRVTAEVVHELSESRGKGRFRLPLTLFSKRGLKPSDLPALEGFVSDLTGVVGGEAHVSWSPNEITAAGEIVSDHLTAQAAGHRLTDATATVRVDFSSTRDEALAVFEVAEMGIETAGVPLKFGTISGKTWSDGSFASVSLEMVAASVEHAADQPWFAPLGFTSRADLSGDEIRFEAEIASVPGRLSVPVSGKHDLRTGVGMAYAGLPGVVFAPNALQPGHISRLAELPNPLRGELKGDVRFNWTPGSFAADSDLLYTGIGYSLPDAAIQNVSGTMNATFEGTAVVRVKNGGGTVRVRGVPIVLRGLSGEGTFDPKERVGRLTVNIGRIEDDRFSPVFLPLSLMGEVRLADNAAQFDTRLDVVGKPASLRAEGRHDIGSGIGRATIQPERLSFADGTMKPGDITPLADIFEAFEGTIGSTVELDWAPGSIGGRAEVELVDLSLETDVVAVTGLEGQIRIDSLSPLAITRSQTLRAREVVSALPLGDPVLSFRLHQKPGETEAVLHVDRFETEIAGGRAVVTGATFDTASEDVSLDVDLLDVDLGQIMEIVDVKDVSATGRLAGKIPIRIGQGSVLIDKGELKTAAPGVLKVRSSQVREALSGGGEQATLLLDVLEDFHYDRLALRIDKTADGGDTVTLSTSGNNPAVKDGHPFVLNINLSTNLEKLTRALLEGYRLSEGALRTTLGLRGNR